MDHAQETQAKKYHTKISIDCSDCTELSDNLQEIFLKINNTVFSKSKISKAKILNYALSKIKETDIKKIQDDSLLALKEKAKLLCDQYNKENGTTYSFEEFAAIRLTNNH